MTLQKSLDDTKWRLSVRAPIITALGLLNLTLEVVFHLDHCDDLGTGIHQFGTGQHTSAAWKVLKASSD